ncbi:hypothetical protein CHUAL_006508 [Chamberlinius hualienensis]
MFIIFLIASFGSAVAQQETKCDNRYYNVSEAIAGVSNCTYATENFNPVCVEDSLPALSSQSLYPVNNDGSINEENFKQILKITENGLKQPEICQKELNPIFFEPFTVIINQLLPPYVTGECKVVKNSNNNITNIKNTQISFINSPDIGKANVSINASLTYNAPDVECKFTFLNEVKPVNVFVNISIEVNFDITAECTFSVNKNNPTFTIDFANVIVKLNVSGFNGPLLMSLLPIFDNKATELISNSPLPKYFANFIATIVVDALAASAKKS